MFTQKPQRKFKVNRKLSDFAGNALIVGCGHDKIHHFNFTAKGIPSEELHPATDFYHLSLKSDYSDEGHLDLEGNFLDDSVIKYLSKKKFDLICFEAVTEIFSDENSRDKALENVSQILSEKGVCFIYFGGRDDLTILDDVISRFKESYSFTYGLNDTWSILVANHPFDLTETVEKYPYLNHMINEVIKPKMNLTISFNYYEPLLDRHLKSANPADREAIEMLNPFASTNLDKAPSPSPSPKRK